MKWIQLNGYMLFYLELCPLTCGTKTVKALFWGAGFGWFSQAGPPKTPFTILIAWNCSMFHCMQEPACSNRLQSCSTLNALIKLVHANMTVLTFPNRLFGSVRLPYGAMWCCCTGCSNCRKFTLIFPYKVRGIHLDLHDVSRGGPHGDSVKECGTSRQPHRGLLQQLFSWMSVPR